ncbi:MAG: phosphoribosylformylglycinamidine synthase subunit PurQ [Actinomycetota bacterium]|nr:phosphoribosylformylglycinamidine synthase subunit PurQ [Actinomycetota bacterium]
MPPTVGVVVFPGTNCEHDVVHALGLLGMHAEIKWHGDSELGACDAVVLPGGFAHGDYLRPGAIARFSNVMNAIIEMAEAGKPVLGICNGFQVLTEAKLLPGALQKNAGLRFICDVEKLEVVSNRSAASGLMQPGEIISLPINHFEGNYTCDQVTHDSLVENDQIVFKYVDNPNGSVGSIAGISNIRGNVVGMMPHPERAVEEIVGGTDGRKVLGSFIREILNS